MQENGGHLFGRRFLVQASTCVSSVRVTHNPCHSEGTKCPKNPERNNCRGDRPVAPTTNNHAFPGDYLPQRGCQSETGLLVSRVRPVPSGWMR